MAAPPLTFYGWTEAQVRARVEANPKHVREFCVGGNTPLHAAANGFQSLSLVLWLLDEKDADVNRG